MRADGALVRPIAVARCDLDAMIVTGKTGMQGPFALGHEMVAEIVEVGSAVARFNPGQRVIVPFQIGCGQCANCRCGETGSCSEVPLLSAFGMAPLSGVEHGGALSDLIRVPFAPAMLVRAPEGVAPEVLASAADNLLDGWRTIAPHLAARPPGRRRGAPARPMSSARSDASPPALRDRGRSRPGGRRRRRSSRRSASCPTRRGHRRFEGRNEHWSCGEINAECHD